MRRPIVFTAMAFALGIAGQHMFKLNGSLLAGLLLIVVGCFVFMLFKNKNQPSTYNFILVALLVIGAIFCNIEELKTSRLLISGKPIITGEGIIKSVVKKDENYFKLVIITNRVFSSVIKENTILNYYGNLEEDYSLDDLIGRSIRFKGIVSEPDKNRNPKTFNYREYLRTVGIYSLIKCNSGELLIGEEITGEPDKLLHYLSGIKGKITENLIFTIGKERTGIINGMMWGEVDQISDDAMEQFRMNGTAHILSVSGIHVGLVYLYLNKLLLGRKNLGFDILVMLLLLCYAAMAAFSPSVVRAVSMIILHIVSKHAFCRYDMLSCGGAVMLFMLLLNPLSLFNVGFQLSFSAIFALAVLVPFMEKIHKSFIAPIIAIQIGLSPMTAYVFNYFSLGSILANIPVIFIASLVIPLGLITIPAVIFGLPLALFNLLAMPMGTLIDAMMFINELIYMPGKSFFYVKSPSIFLMILYYFSLFFMTSEIFQIMVARRKYYAIGKFVTVAILVAILVNFMLYTEISKAELIFADVGQGDCLHIKTSNGKNFLIDGGGNLNYDIGSRVLMPYLLKNGVDKIDAAFVTHLHQDHYGGIVSLAKKGLIKKIYIYEGNKMEEDRILEETGMSKSQIFYIGKGDRIILEEDVFIDVLYPDRKSEEGYRKLLENETDENENSLIVKLNYKYVSVLMTGDIDFDGEFSLMREYFGTEKLNASILKVSHHGSKNGTGGEFLEIVSPETAVIQVGKNNFGHPAQEVIDKLEQKGIRVFRNDFNGAIGISVENSVQTEERLKIITLYE